MPKVTMIYGTRPEAIKMAPLVAAVREHPRLVPVVAVTGQHREMLDQVNALFQIQPDHDLNIMVPGASLGEISTRVLEAVGRLLRYEASDAVVVQGDTTSAMMAALAAFYEGVPVVHLEAGLRTGDMASPFPEEANRRLIAPLASLHLAPTPRARANLLAEGIGSSDVVVTGNTVIDALQATLKAPAAFADPRLTEVVQSRDQILLVTAHRRESWGAKMREALTAVRYIALAHPELRIVLPMHRNALVREVVEPVLGDVPSVLLTEPLDYLSFTHLLAACHIVLTDSGGVQEEAPSLGKPVLVMRDTTERPEAVEAGTVKLVGTDGADIVELVEQLLTDRAVYNRFATATNPYGDGLAAGRSVAAICELLGVGERVKDFSANAESF